MHACGLAVYVDGNAFTSAFATGSGGMNHAILASIDQSSVTGNGTRLNPFSVVTRTRAGDSGVEFSQTDVYTAGDNTYKTELRVTNGSGVPRAVVVYRGMNCFSPYGGVRAYGSVTGGTIGCTQSVDGHGKTTAWAPVTPGSTYISLPASSPPPGFLGFNGDPLPNTCECELLDYRSAVIRKHHTMDPPRGPKTKTRNVLPAAV